MQRLQRSGLALLPILFLQAGAQVAEELQKITPSDPEWTQSFGAALAIEGDALVVGAIGTSPKGAFYSYTRTGTTWGNETKFTGPASGSLFGRPLDLDNGILVVGDPSKTNANGQDAGSAYVYQQFGSGWLFVQELIAPGGTQFDKFSRSLAMAGNTIVIGATAANGIAFQSGSAYVFEFDGTSWNPSQILAPSRGHGGMGFGASVTIDQHACRIVVSATTENSMVTANIGAAYVFKKEPEGWVEEARLWDPMAASSEFFGASVRIDGERLLVGATGNDDMASNAGTVWVYELQNGSWTAVDKLHASDTFQDHRFGHHVRLKGDTALVSGHLSPAAVYKVYQFQKTGTQWVETAQLLNSDNANFDGFAEYFDFDGGNVVVTGANGAYAGPIRCGAAYVHVLDVPTQPYCSAKSSSAGCLPAIFDSGAPTFTGTDDYVVQADDCLPSKPGLFFFGLQGPLAAPFFNGTLCVAPPLARTPVQLATTGAGCSGTYAFPLTQALMAAKGLFPGKTVHGQYWMRDPDHPDGTGVGLSNALELSIQP